MSDTWPEKTKIQYMSNLHDSTGCLASYLSDYLNHCETERLEEIIKFMGKVEYDLKRLRFFFPDK